MALLQILRSMTYQGIVLSGKVMLLWPKIAPVYRIPWWNNRQLKCVITKFGQRTYTIYKWSFRFWYIQYFTKRRSYHVQVWSCRKTHNTWNPLCLVIFHLAKLFQGTPSLLINQLIKPIDSINGIQFLMFSRFLCYNIPSQSFFCVG